MFKQCRLMIKTKLLNTILHVQDIKKSSASIQNSEPTILLVSEGRLLGLHPQECGQQGDKIVLPVKKRQQQKFKLILTVYSVYFA